MNIALLEDNPAILDYMSTALHMAGYTIYVHTDGPSLLAALFHQVDVGTPLPYDLLIVDLLLPGYISGADTIRRIHQTIPPDSLPIIIVSAGSQGELAQAKASFPHVPILRKPFRMSSLLHIIEQLRPF
jgi:DNA-binding response OmpR family regulator